MDQTVVMYILMCRTDHVSADLVMVHLVIND